MVNMQEKTLGLKNEDIAIGAVVVVLGSMLTIAGIEAYKDGCEMVNAIQQSGIFDRANEILSSSPMELFEQAKNSKSVQFVTEALIIGGAVTAVALPLVGTVFAIKKGREAVEAHKATQNSLTNVRD